MQKKLIIFGFIVLLGIGAYSLFSQISAVSIHNPFSIASSTSSAAAVAVSEREVPPGFKEYNNVRYRVSLLYPDELAVQELQEEGNAITITFENIDKAEGFQIFILPYYYPQVTPERFKQDEPSGVRDNLTEIKINGATGAAFYGKSTALGDTYELWFIHNGYLYEVTSLKPLDTWLNQIMQTWKFI